PAQLLPRRSIDARAPFMNVCHGLGRRVWTHGTLRRNCTRQRVVNLTNGRRRSIVLIFPIVLPLILLVSAGFFFALLHDSRRNVVVPEVKSRRARFAGRKE